MEKNSKSKNFLQENKWRGTCPQLEACKKRHLMDNFLDDFHNKFHWIKKTDYVVRPTNWIKNVIKRVDKIM